MIEYPENSENQVTPEPASGTPPAPPPQFLEETKKELQRKAGISMRIFIVLAWLYGIGLFFLILHTIQDAPTREFWSKANPVFKCLFACIFFGLTGHLGLKGISWIHTAVLIMYSVSILGMIVEIIMSGLTPAYIIGIIIQPVILLIVGYSFQAQRELDRLLKEHPELRNTSPFESDQE